MSVAIYPRLGSLFANWRCRVTQRPPSWPLVVGVLVDAPTAARLVDLLADGRRRARLNAWKLPAELVTTLDALERLAAAHKGASVASAPPGPTMSTAEAATMLGVTVRRVVALLAEGRLNGRREGRRWLVDAADVILRLPSEPSEPLTESEKWAV